MDRPTQESQTSAVSISQRIPLRNYTPNEIGQIEQKRSIEKQIEENLKVLKGWVKSCFDKSIDDSMNTNLHENIASKVKETLEFLGKLSAIIPPLNKREMYINSKSSFIFRRIHQLIEIFNYRPHLNLLLPKTQESKNTVEINLDSKISSEQYVTEYVRNIHFCNQQKHLILQEIFTKKTHLKNTYSVTKILKSDYLSRGKFDHEEFVKIIEIISEMEKQNISTDKIRVAVFEKFFNEFNFETFLDFTKNPPQPFNPEILEILLKMDDPNTSSDDKKSELINDYGLSQKKFQRDFLPSLVAFCDEGNWLKIKPKLLEYIYSDNSDSNLLYLNDTIAFLYRTAKKYNLNYLDRIQEILEPFLKQADLPSSIYFDWVKANYTLKAENSSVNTRFIAENLVVIKKLEEHEKGLAKKIYTSCGVVNFRRYSPEILIDMYNNLEAGSPYILLATANDDHNGVNSEMTHQVSNDIHSNLEENGENTRLLVTDASSISDILKIIKSQKFPPTTVIISAHGNEDGFYLDKNIYGDIDTESLNNRTVFLINELVKNNIKVIFIACSVGKEGGFQDKLQNLFPNIKIVAPYSNILADVRVEMDSEDNITKVDYCQIGGVESHYSPNF